MALTDKQIEQERKFLEGVPRFNLAAFLMPPLWGPVNGFWVTILFYPLWLFTDNMIYAAYANPSALTIVLAVLVGAVLLGGMMAFSLVSQPIAYHRAADKGMSKEQYLKRQRIWAVVSVVLAVLMLGFASYYNLCIRAEV